jgi:hypothetical protein
MSQEKSYFAPRKVSAFTMDSTPDAIAAVFPDLHKIGIGLDTHHVQAAAHALGMDSIENPQLPVTGGIPVQFLQSWLSGFVEIATAPTTLDELIGVSVVGDWKDEEVVQGVLELTGTPRPYGDYSSTPLSSWNPAFERRTVVRFEEGLQVGVLEAARAGAINLDTASLKRRAAAKALNINRNSIGFYGYVGRTYGFLNDPALSAYVTVAAGAATGDPTEWSDKTFQEIVADIRTAISALRVQSGNVVNPEKAPLTLAVATASYEYLSVATDFNVSVRQWIKDNYPNMRIVPVIELDGADGGENVFYLYAESVDDTGTDDGRVFSQLVPTIFQMLGTEQKAKSFIESYTNATAGTLCKRPYAVVRYSGI